MTARLLFVLQGSALSRGMNTGLENLAWGLADRGWPVTILAGGAAPEQHHFSVPSQVSYEFTGQPGTPEAHFAAVARLQPRLRAEVVIGWMRFLLPISQSLAAQEPRPVFVVNEGMTINRGHHSRLRRSVRRAWSLVRTGRFLSPASVSSPGRHLDYAVGISDAVVSDLKDCYGLPPERVLKIARGVDTGLFKPLLKRPARQSRAFRLIYTGDIVPRKGLETAVRAVNLLSEPVELCLCGSDRDQFLARLQSMLSPDGPHRIVFRDRLSSAEVCGELQASDAFIFLSHSEGLGKSLLEAMACGLPVVASDHRAFSALLDDEKNALITPMLDSNAVAAALVRLMDDDSLRARLGQAAHMRVAEGFSREGELDAWEALLRRALPKKTMRCN